MGFQQRCRRALSLTCSLLVVFAVISPISHADTYRTVSLGTDAARYLYGIDDSGTVVLDTSAQCNTTCYAVYAGGVYTGTTVNPPNFAWDNGAACSPAVAGYVVEHAVCNGGLVAWTGYPAGDLNQTGVFTGTDPLTDRLAMGGEGPLMLNSLGDIVFDDHMSEQFYVAFASATTPEPASISLLGTGALALTAEGWRRRRRSSHA